MKNQHSLPRRSFIKMTVAAAVSGATVVACSRTSRGHWRFLSDEEAALVESISEQIIPEDQDPGGRYAGCVNFIDRQLCGPYKRYQKVYREGLARLEQTCSALYQKPWAGLAFSQQTELLTALEADQAPEGIWEKGTAARFFGLVRDHCLQGFYGSPRHGGNRNYVSYRMLGLDYPQICGRNLKS